MNVEETVKNELSAIVVETLNALMDSYQTITSNMTWEEYCIQFKTILDRQYYTEWLKGKF